MRAALILVLAQSFALAQQDSQDEAARRAVKSALAEPQREDAIKTLRKVGPTSIGALVDVVRRDDKDDMDGMIGIGESYVHPKTKPPLVPYWPRPLNNIDSQFPSYSDAVILNPDVAFLSAHAASAAD